MPDPDNQQSNDQTSSQLVTVGQNAVVAINQLNNTLSSESATATLSTISTTLGTINTTLGLINSTIGTTFPNWKTAPANSTASGVSGQVAYSGSSITSSYFYVCLTSGATGSATWGRVLLTTSF